MDPSSHSNFKKKKKKFVGIKNQIKQMSKEAVKAALEKKKKCNDRAIEIVNLLIEPAVTEEYLLNCAFDINQSHFDDVIEERAIQKLCGYPLCSNPLVNVPLKQFQISTKTNKVYDISERKNFCSNLCYKAGKYLKDQLYTSPLWLREHEDPISFTLLPFTVNSGSSGEEVDLGHSPITLGEPLFDESDRSVEIEQDADEFLGKFDEEGDSAVEEKVNADEEDDCALEEKINEEVEDELLVEDKKSEEEKMDFKEITESLSCDLLSRLEEMELSESSASLESQIKVIREPIPVNTKSEVTTPSSETKQKTSRQSSRKTLSPKEVIIKIEKTVQSWFTFETFCFILGESEVKSELDQLGLQLQRQNSDPYLYDRYADLCKRLNLLEIKEAYGSKEIESPKKPLPDFDKLKDESKELEIKVKSFFNGEFQYEVEDCEVVPDDQLPILPPLDQYATKAIRRRIFLQKLHQSLHDIQEALGLSQIYIAEQIKEFSTTLNLTAQNICLKPSEWNIVAIILIKLLSLRDNNLKEGLALKTASNYFELLLMSYTLDSGYLDRLVCWLLDINFLVNSDQV